MRESIVGAETAALHCRTIAVKPDIVLMDEPCWPLDPDSFKIEELMPKLKKIMRCDCYPLLQQAAGLG